LDERQSIEEVFIFNMGIKISEEIGEETSQVVPQVDTTAKNIGAVIEKFVGIFIPIPVPVIIILVHKT